MKIGVLIPTRDEVPDCIEIYRENRRSYGDFDIDLRILGIGQRDASVSARRFLAYSHPDFVIHSGFCGGVCGRVDIGDILIADNVVYGGEKLKINHGGLELGVLERCLLGIDYHVGCIQTVDRFCGSLNDLSDGVDGVDMESFGVVGEVEKCGAPYIIARSVSDIISSLQGDFYGDVALTSLNEFFCNLFNVCSWIPII